MDTRRLLLAALLSLAVMVVWGYLFPPPTPVSPQVADEESGPAAIEVPAAVEQPSADSAGPEQEVELPDEQELAVEEPLADDEEAAQPVAAESEQLVTVDGDRFRAVLTNRGASLVSFQLLRHESAAGGPVDLVRARSGPPLDLGITGAEGQAHPLDEALFAVDRSGGQVGEDVITFRYSGPLGRAEKRFTFRPDGLFELAVSVPGRRDWALALGPGVRNPSIEELASRFAQRSAAFRTAEELVLVDPLRTDETRLVAGAGLRWVALQDTYFLTALLPREGLDDVMLRPLLALADPTGEGQRFLGLEAEGSLGEEQKEEAAREMQALLRPRQDSLTVLCFMGPKQYDRLAALPYGLEETVNLGWFKILSRPLLFGLRWIHDHLVPNYGWAIILMTVLIRLLLFPLTHKSTVSMQKMQQLNPKVQAIRQKYRSKLKDKQGRPNSEMQRKMNEEMMALYKQEGVNPAGGCLPMLLQIPVLFAFYNLLSAAIELRNAPWILWIGDLSAKDPYYVLPIVMGASQFLQQKMTPAAGDPMQRRMFALMPIFFTVLFLGFPSGLVLYWLTNNLLGIAQQAIYRRSQSTKPEAGSKEPSPKSKRGSET